MLRENLFYSDSLHYSFSTRDELLKFFRDDDGMPQKCVFHRSVFDERGHIGRRNILIRARINTTEPCGLKLVEDRIVDWREYQHLSENTWEEFWKRA